MPHNNLMISSMKMAVYDVIPSTICSRSRLGTRRGKSQDSQGLGKRKEAPRRKGELYTTRLVQLQSHGAVFHSELKAIRLDLCREMAR